MGANVISAIGGILLGYVITRLYDEYQRSIPLIWPLTTSRDRFRTI